MAKLEPVGLLGLGNMGSALAQRLLSQQTPLHVYDPSPNALQTAVSRGAVAHGSALSVANAVPLVITCVASVEISAQIAVQVAEGSRIRCYLEMSTIGPDAA